ncbi:hypothetical protein [Glycomyces arizonensis]|uniref:hypothetical protein n=1 Tax=Glycomyces arizonensis TaxID=256035 RepID=UPI00041D6BE6|nr:hypothetical protein [Glycomyces arizonensis]
MTRRLAFVATVAGMLVAVASPAMAFQHDRVHNPWLHGFLDIASLAIVIAPIWTALLWGAGRSRWLLAGIVLIVQVPVAVLAFVPAVSHALQGAGLGIGLAITIAAIVYTRRAARAEKKAAAQAAGT